MGKTVLIVDDHPSFRASARLMLEAHGYEVVGEAEDGGAAIAAVQVQRPDLVLLDVRLPDMSGLKVLQTIRRGNKSRDIPVIVVTVVSETSAITGFPVHDVTAGGEGDIDVHSISGSVAIALPAGVRPNVHARSFGRIQSDVEEGDDCRVRVKSASGSITLAEG